MHTTKQKTSRRHKYKIYTVRTASVIIVLLIVVFLVYRVSTGQSILPSIVTQKSAQFDENVKLTLNQTARFGSGDESVKFRFTKLEPASNPDAECDELCYDWLPTITTELKYAGKTYQGNSTSKTGTIGMSYEKNGAYPLIPYIVKLVGVDFDERTATVNITKKEFKKVEPGKEFSIGNDGVAVLTPAETGIHIKFGVCGFDESCIREMDFYVDGEYVSVPIGFTDTPSQSESTDNNFIEAGDVRLRFIDTDGETYARFVLEKV